MKAQRIIKAASPLRRLTATGTEKRCVVKTRTGEACKAPPLRGRDRCAFHSPGQAVICGQRGGRRRAVFDPENLKPLPTPQEAADYLRIVAQTVIDLRGAKIDAKTAMGIFQGCGTAAPRLLELVNLDARVRILEGRQAELDQARNGGRR